MTFPLLHPQLINQGRRRSLGLAPILGRVPDVLFEAKKANNVAAGTWPATYGTDGTEKGSLVYNATGYGGVSPAVEFTESSGDALSIPGLVAAQDADPELPHVIVFAADLQPHASASRALWAWGSDGTNNPRIELLIQPGGEIQWVTTNDSGTLENNTTSAATLSGSKVRTIIATRFIGSGANGLRTIARQAGSETVFHDNVTVSAMGAHTLTDFELMHLPWGSDGFTPNADVALFAAAQGSELATFSDQQLSDLAAHVDSLLPTS